MRICLDPGHHKNVLGKRSPAVPPGIIEWEFNLAVAMIAEVCLKEHGHEVVRTMSLADRVNKTLRQRRNLAAGCDCLVSIHANAAAGAEWCGGSGFIVFHNPAGAGLAGRLAESYRVAVPEIPPRGRGWRVKTELGILRTPMPAALIECGFMTDRREAALLATSELQKRIGRAIAAGIERGSL